MRRTPLYDEHVAAGARMVEFAGFAMPVQYHSIVEEHRAVRSGVGLFDVSHMGEVSIRGPRAVECVASLFTNDATSLLPGRAQYSLIANDHGGVVDDVIVYRLSDDEFLVCVNASNTVKDFEWIRARAPSGGCEVEDLSESYGLIAVQGPAAAGIASAVFQGASTLPRFGFAKTEFAGRTALVARTGYTGEDGFEIFCAASTAVALWLRLVELGGVPAGLGARDTLRLEAALPLYGHELGEDVSPYEARVGWAVKLTRPNMVGFRALEESRGNPAKRRLVGLQIDEGIAREGCAVLASGSRIGTVTSGSHSPTLGRAIALALLDRDPCGAALAVDVRGKVRNAQVTRLPFHVRQQNQSESH